MKVLRVLCLVMCAAHAFAQTKRFVCAGGGAAGEIKRITVTVVTKVATILGAPHNVGTTEIGRVSDMTFWVSWDATEPSASVGRTDADGFLAAASAADATLIVLRSKKANQAEATMACSGR